MSYRDDVPHNDYKAGFEVGYRSVKGKNVMLPMVPMRPMTRMNMSPFLMGVRKGLQHAGIDPDTV
jgi:hypothetical protein